MEPHVHATDRNEVYALRKMQRGLSAIETWCKHWNLKNNKDKTQAIYFSLILWHPEAHLTLNVQNIPFGNHEKYLGVTFNKRITWRQHIEMTKAKAFYSLFKSWRLSANIKLTLHKALIR
jgi:hypothetical protein